MTDILYPDFQCKNKKNYTKTTIGVEPGEFPLTAEQMEMRMRAAAIMAMVDTSPAEMIPYAAPESDPA